MLTENTAGAFGWWLRAMYVAMKTGSRANGERLLIENRGPAAAARLLKAPVGAASSLDSQVDAQTVIGPFTDSVASASAFMEILLQGGFQRLSFRQRIAVMTSDPTAAVITPGAAIPISKTVIGNTLLEPVLVSSMISLTDTVMMDISANGQQLLNRTVRAAIGACVDATMFSELIGDSTGALTFASSGNAPGDAMNDLRTMMLAITNSIDTNPKFFFVSSPDTAVKATTLSSNGVPVWPTASPAGGQLMGTPLLVSSGVPPGEIYYLQAGAIAAAAGLLDVKLSDQADAEMSDAPSSSSTVPTGTSMVSAWQTNSVYVRGVMPVAAVVLHEPAISRLTGVDWGA